MGTKEDKNLVVKQESQISTQHATRLGFEDEQEGDIVLPRAKILQPTSDELSNERYADQNFKGGMIINSLTKEVLSDKFIPIMKFNSRMLWVPKKAGGGMACRSEDAKVGKVLDAPKWGPWNESTNTYHPAYEVQTGQNVACDTCPYANWNGDVPPLCTKSMNFLVMFDGMSFPLVLSFKSTSLKHGKKLYSMAKMMPGNMFDYVYSLKTFRKSNDRGVFFESDVFPGGKATAEQAKNLFELYSSFRNLAIKFDDSEDADDKAAGFADSVTEKM